MRFFAPSGAEVLMLPPLLRLRRHMPAGATFEEVMRVDGQIRDAIGTVFVEMTQQMAEYIRVAQKTTVFAGLWWAGGGTEAVRQLCSKMIVEGTLGFHGTTVLANAYSMGLIDIAANPTVAVLGVLFNGLGGYGYSLMNTYAILWCTNRVLEYWAAGGDETNPLARETIDFVQGLAAHIRAHPNGGANNHPLAYRGAVEDLAHAPRLTDQLGIIMGWAANGFREMAGSAAMAATMLDRAPGHFVEYIQERGSEAADAAARVIPDAIQNAAQQAVEEQARQNAMEVMRYEQRGDPGFRAIQPEPQGAAPRMSRVLRNIGEGFLAGVMDAINSANYVVRGQAAMESGARMSSLQQANLRMAQWFAEMYLRHHTQYLVESAQAVWQGALDRELTNTEAQLHADIAELQATTPDIMAGPAAAGRPILRRRSSTQAERRAAGDLLRRVSERGADEPLPEDAGVVATAAATAADLPVPGDAAVVRRLSGSPPPSPSAPPADVVFGAAAAREGSITPTYEEWQAGNPGAAAAAADPSGPGDLSEFFGGSTRRKRVRRKRKTRKGGGSKRKIGYARGGRVGGSRRLGRKGRGGRRTRRARGGRKRLR